MTGKNSVNYGNLNINKQTFLCQKNMNKYSKKIKNMKFKFNNKKFIFNNNKNKQKLI